jgi:hypothetical protein
MRISIAATALAMLVALPLGEFEASADVTGDAYQDVKNIITDLLTSEVARSLVPQVVCRAGHQVTPSLIECPAATDPAKICIKQGNRFTVIKLKAMEYFPATLQALYSRRFASLKSTVANESVDVASDTLYQGLRDVFSTLKKQEQAARNQEIRQAIAYANEVAPSDATVFDPLDEGTLSSCVAKVKEKLNEGLPPTVSRIDNECSPSSKDNAFECELAQSARLALRGKPEEADSHIRRAMAIVLAYGLTKRLSLGTEHLKDVADEVLFLVRSLEANTQSYDTYITEIATRNATMLKKKAEEIIAVLQQQRIAITRVVARIRAVTSGGNVKLTINAMIADLAEVLGGADSICDQIADGPCKLLTELDQRVGRLSLIWPAVAAASSGDLHGVAHLVVSALFQNNTSGADCERQTGDEGCKLDTFRRFADSLVMYVLDASGGDTSDTVRSVFRQSAEEVIRLVSPYGGLDRAGVGGAFIFLIPELALRASWSSAYVNDSDRHLRYIIGLNMLRIRKVLWYTSRSYTSVQLALLDPVAPLAEIAVRANRDPLTSAQVNYQGTELLFWNLLAPRLEFTAALPWLSKHLAVSAGASLRMAAPTERSVLGSGEVSYRYHGLFAEGRGDDWYKFIEFGLSLKYIM